LESYHPYLQPQKVSKNPKFYCIHKYLPKNSKSRFDFLGPLGVNSIWWRFDEVVKGQNPPKQPSLLWRLQMGSHRVWDGGTPALNNGNNGLNWDKGVKEFGVKNTS
jgi:hypothetical protein